MAITTPLGDDPMVQGVSAYVREHMSRYNYDASHNFEHIQRVVALAQHIYAASPIRHRLDARTVTLSALLHDVGDRKYLRPGDEPATMVRDVLGALGAPPALAAAVQAICTGVSWSAEQRDPASTRALIARHPELAVVQDADRLDAIGAIGVGRCFTFGGARTESSMEEALAQLEGRLLRIEGLMKTEAGRLLAAERCRRLRLFRDWWRDEAGFLEEVSSP